MLKNPDEVREEYNRKIVQTALDLFNACEPIFNTVDSNIGINALKLAHAWFICMIRKNDPTGCMESAKVETEYLLQNVKHIIDGN